MKSDDATSRPPIPWPNVLISNPTAVVHVLTKRLTPPTNVQVYCLLFNSQGQLVEHMDHHTASKDGAIVQEARNQYGHDQKFVVTLAKVNPGIDVIGFIISHSDDMIFDPTKALEACSVQCVLHLHNVDEILTHVHGDILCDADFATSPGRDKAFLFRNAVMVCKLYRDGRQRSHWNFNPIVEGMKCASHCIVGLTRCAQLHLVDIMPDIDIPNVTSLNSIYGICSALSSVEFLAFENMFPVDGFDKQSFATCLCEGMVHSRPELRSEKRIVALLSLLFEMFDQIDINGDGHVDWEEFTSFCVALGMISTKQSKLGSKSVEFTYKPHACHGTKTFPYHMTKLKCFEHLRKVAVLESMSPVISIFDFDGHFLHEMTSIAKSSVMKEGLYVLDMDHVPSKNCYVVAASDRSITIWSILNAVKGQYVQSGKIINHDMAMVVKWCPVLKLCFTSSVKHATLWNLDKCKVEHKLPFHSDFVTDVVELAAATRMFATCSFDHKVAVWEVDRMKVVFELTKHTQAVTHMDCNGNVLVSCGFEHHAHVWSIATRKHLVMLTGHHDALLDVKLTRQHAAHLFCVTGDASGHFKVWDISRCIVDASKDAAVVLHTYTISGGGVDTTSSLLYSFAVVPDHKRKTPLPEIWTGNFHVVRLVPDMIASLDSPLQYVLYNQVSHSFTASIAGRITVWSGKSGAIIQEPILISNVDVCGLCFDLPRQRKLFVATSDGSIRMYNPITGVLMDTAKLHGGEILGMIYCERTHCIISNATDDSLSICNDVPGEGRLDPLRTIANVNKNPMTSCAYSSEHGFIATGDASGRIRVHDFQRLSLIFCCENGGKANCEVTALAFHKQTCVLFAGYSTGEVKVWHILHGIQSSKSQCIMRLTTTATSSSSLSFLTETPPQTTPVCGINSLCVTEDTDHSFASIIAGDDNGMIHCWPLRVLRQHARGILKLCFEPLPDTMIAYTRGGYNPNLRLSRRQSVSSSPQKHTFSTGSTSQRLTEVVCVAETLTWKAHDAKVLQVQPLQFPGFFYSYDDFGVKLWDAQGDCLGTLQRKYDEAPDNQTPLEWQYRTSVLFKDNSAEMHALATQILTRVANKEEVVLSEPNDDAAADDVPRAEEEDVTGYLGETKKASPRTLHWTKSLAKLKRTAKKLDDTIGWSHSMENVKAEHDTAFSRQSLQDGLKDGVFTQEESLWLERMSRDDHQRRNYETILFPPLLLSPVELKKRYAKQFVKMGHEPIETLPMLRTCDHFAHEIAVKKASKQPRAVQAIEEPSPFLKQHLATETAAATTSPGKKKTRKRRIPMDGHGFVQTTIVPLPALAAPPHHESSLMTRSTSTPVLPSRDHDRMEKPDGVQQEVRPDVRDNIVRKMTLCATLRHDVEAPKTLRRSGTMSTADKTRMIDPVEWAKAGKNPFGPHYSVRQVLEFGETLLRFDKDLSGDIDHDEWMKIMTAFMTKTQAVDVAVAKDLFASVDLNQDGLISLHELLRVVFCHATKTQWCLMEDFIRRSSHGAHVEQDIKSKSVGM